MLALLVASPMSDRASTRATDTSYPASSRATAQPTTPAPTTTTSTSASRGVMAHRRRAARVPPRPASAPWRRRPGPATTAARRRRPAPRPSRHRRTTPPSRRTGGPAWLRRAPSRAGRRRPPPGRWRRSAWTCIRAREAVSPPSTRSTSVGRPVSASTTSTSATTCAAIPSTTARTRAAAVVARLSPSNEPRASDRHHGAASPASPGTNTTPSASAAHPCVQRARVGQETQVDEPADGGRRREHLAVDAVRRSRPSAPRHRGGQAVAGARCRVTGVRQQEGPGAVRALGRAGRPAALAQQRGLLVDDQPAQRQRAPEGGRLADDLVARGQSRQGLPRQAEQCAQPLVPGDLVDVQEQGAARGRHVGDEGARQPVHEPAVGRRDDPARGDMPPDPRHLGRGEVGIQHQARCAGPAGPPRHAARRRPTLRGRPATPAPGSAAPPTRGPRRAPSRPGSPGPRHSPRRARPRAHVARSRARRPAARSDPARPHRPAGSADGPAPPPGRAPRRPPRPRRPWCPTCPGRSRGRSRARM